MVTIRDLQAVEARQRQMRNAGVTPALEVHRRLVANTMSPALGAYQRQINQMVTSALAPALENYQRQINQMVTSALAPALENYQRLNYQRIEQLLLAAQRGQVTDDLVSPRLDLATEPPASSWPPFPALAFHAAVTAFVAFVLLAFWEEKKDDAPAEALLVIIGTLFAWAQFNQQVWNRYLK